MDVFFMWECRACHSQLFLSYYVLCLYWVFEVSNYFSCSGVWLQWCSWKVLYRAVDLKVWQFRICIVVVFCVFCLVTHFQCLIFWFNQKRDLNMSKLIHFAFRWTVISWSAERLDATAFPQVTRRAPMRSQEINSQIGLRYDYGPPNEIPASR